jgi:hypothetical protein
MPKKKPKNKIKIYATVIVVILVVIGSFMYFTKNHIGFQEKNESYTRLEGKINALNGMDNINHAVKNCVLSLYWASEKRLNENDKTYKNLEDNADAICASYMLGLEEGCGSGTWKKRKTYI